MTKTLLLAVSLMIGITPVVASGSPPVNRSADSIRDRLVGSWRLLWLEEQGSDGNMHRADCTGLFIFTPDGHASVQVMYRDPQAGNGPVHYAQGGYEASYGTYEIDDARTFTFHVEGALVRTLIGKDLKRVYELSGNQLIVKSSDPNEHWRVAWQRS